jgi:serine/threonine-protein kinase
MAAIAADRNLLFGLLALQNGLINQGQLVAAFQAWTLDKACALADHLVGRGDLDADDRSAVDALVARHIKKHGGDVERSLAAVPAGRSTRESLVRIGDPDVGGTLARLGSTHHGDVADRTATYAVGTTTSEGQRFRVLRPHARGGLGAVFVALDGELNREVALKQIHDEHADDPISRQRFLVEAEVTGGLEHPGIVPVYGLGTYADGRPYYAMRFIRGDSLKETIQRFHDDPALKAEPGRRSLELRKLLRRFIDVCNAIDYAHSRGVLHRDIKPSNIIVGKHGETLVVDWGLAKATGRAEPGVEERTLVPSLSSGSAETLPGSALGTPSYMSPEQARGDLEHLGPRSDVYSLGATLYCILTGRPPLEGDDLGELLRRSQRGEFPRPRQHDATIDPALEAVCLNAMALSPHDRYATPRLLVEDIERWMADEPVSAWHEPWTRRLLRWLTRHRTGVTAAGAAMLVALAGTGAVLAVQTQANQELKQSNTKLEIANREVTRANGELAASNERERARFALAQEAIRTFHSGVSEDILLKQEEFKALRTKLLRGAREFYRKLEGLLQRHADRDSRLALGRAYFEVGELTRDLDSVDEARTVHERAADLFEALSREDPADPEPRHSLARSLQTLSLILGNIGRANDAGAMLKRSREIYRALAAAAPTDLRLQGEWARGEMLYSMSLKRNRRFDEAKEVIQHARAILEAAVAADPGSRDLDLQLLEVYGAQALVLGDSGQRDEAVAAYTKACNVAEALFRAKPEDSWTSHELVRTEGNMAVSLYAIGRYAEALAAVDRAREVLKAAGKAHPTLIMFRADSAWIETLAAYALDMLGRDKEALAALERARAAREVLIKANPGIMRNHEELIEVHRLTAAISNRAGRMPEALASFERARGIAATLVDSQPENREYRLTLAEICGSLGDLQSKMGKRADAFVRFDEAHSAYRKLVEADPSASSLQSQLARTLLQLGIAAQKLNRPADAVSHFRQSIKVMRGLKGPSSTDIYDIACLHSLLAGVARDPRSGLTPEGGRAAMADAMATLHEAVAAGWHNPASLRDDPDLAPVRSRPDFQLLIMDLEFPPQPFAASN